MAAPWKTHPLFRAGKFQAVVDELLDRPDQGPRRQYIASLLGSLSFLGRVEEAAVLLPLASRSPVDVAAGRFFLAIGWARRSEYEKSRQYLSENEAKAGESPLERFFVNQGRAFLSFYTGRLGPSLEAALAAREAALASGDLYARCLAADALGHVKVRSGEIHAGLKDLVEAAALARKLGNEGTAVAIEISRELYGYEFGLEEKGLDRLRARWGFGSVGNNFTQSSVGLELARQLTLGGSYAEAGAVLEAASPLVYASRNRRHEILLNLRFAELAGRRGEFFQSRHFLWFCRRLLNREVDGSLELQVLGVERKLAFAEGKADEAARLLEHWQHLSEEYSSTRDNNLQVRLGLRAPSGENPEDRVHLVLSQAARGETLYDRLHPLLEKSYLAEAVLVLGLPPGAPALAPLPGKLGLLTQSRDAIEWRQDPLSSLQLKLLRALKDGREKSKEALVKQVWGYAYAPLRHDSMVYAAISGLRKALGPEGAWILASEAGYRLQAIFWEGKAAWPVAAPPEESVPEDAMLAKFNHRQLEILQWLAKLRYVSVQDCKKKFKTSEITALRDLRHLLAHRAVIRTGKARATRYSLARPRKGE